MQFQVRFHENTNPSATSQTGPTTAIRVIASRMIIQRPLQNGPLVAGSQYTFAGMMHDDYQQQSEKQKMISSNLPIDKPTILRGLSYLSNSSLQLHG